MILQKYLSRQIGKFNSLKSAKYIPEFLLRFLC